MAAAEAEFDRARRDWDRAERLYKDDDISTAQYDQYRSRREAAEAALTQARQRQALALAGPRREQVEAAAAQVERARSAVRTAENNRLEIRKREQELPLRRAEIDRAAANLALIDTQIADTVAVSPVDGVVLVKSAEPGEILPPGPRSLRSGTSGTRGCAPISAKPTTAGSSSEPGRGSPPTPTRTRVTRGG